jgi:hypothetical protein
MAGVLLGPAEGEQQPVQPNQLAGLDALQVRQTVLPGPPVGGTGLGAMGEEKPQVGVLAKPIQLVEHDASLS